MDEVVDKVVDEVGAERGRWMRCWLGEVAEYERGCFQG